MKKNKKCIVFIMAALMVTLLAGCGNDGSSGSNAAADIGGKMSEGSGSGADADDASAGQKEQDKAVDPAAGQKEQDKAVDLAEGQKEQNKAVDPAADWQSMFANGNILSIDGNSVTYGPIQMEIPDGYAVEDEAAENPIFYNADHTCSIDFSFGKESYQELSDKAKMQSAIEERHERERLSYVSHFEQEEINIDGYDGYGVGIEYTGKDGQKEQQVCYMIFETVDAEATPMVMMRCTADAETAKSELEGIEAVFKSIRLETSSGIE